MQLKMDLSYLARAGLGIPDYWHPRLDIQPDFRDKKFKRYPVTMSVKADYPGPLDDEGVPIVYWREGEEPVPSPINIVLFGLGSYEASLSDSNPKYARQLADTLRWLERHAVPMGAGIGWVYKMDLPEFGLTGPWFSGITQGLALSLFVRAYQLEGSEIWAHLAHQTWKGFHLPLEQGGVRRQMKRGVIYEEYPAPELDCVFNGMAFALIGLWEAKQSGIVPDAQDDFQEGLEGLRDCLPAFDYKSWSLYSLNKCLGKPLLASPYYHRTNALLADVVGMMTNDELFREYGRRWLSTSESVPRRILMSLRIGLDRFLKAPGLLQRDKSRRNKSKYSHA